MEREKSRPTTIQVAVRVAPCSSFDQNVEWKKTSDCSLVGQEHEVYTFDRVFDVLDPNDAFYDSCARPLIDEALNGFNVTIAAYGQSGSGKTHTLTGNNGEPGIVQLAFRHIFETVTKSDDRQFMLRFAYIELYNEKIADLLVESPNGYDLQIREDSTKSDSTTIEGLSEVVVTNEEQVEELLEAANGVRKVSATNLNERSSRSHAIVRIAIESSDALRASSRCSFVYLLDLAGSENVKQAGTALDGKSRQEAANINKSLLALSNVISALAYNQTAKQLKESAQFVNYRNSKLTRILKPSLGGNSRTLLVCCVSPHTRSESLSTLRFAQKARKIENCPVVCEVTEDGMLAKCLKEIEQLKKQLSEKKSNETQEDGDRQKLKALFAQILSAQSPLAVSSTQIQAKRNRRMTWGGGKLSTLTALTPLDVAVGSFARDRVLASPPSKRHKTLDNIREDDVEIGNRARLAESRSSAVGTGAATEDLEMTTCSTATTVENKERERLSSSRSPNQDVNNALLASKEVEELKQKVIELETANAALIAQNGRIAEESEQLVGHLRTSIQDLTNTMDLYDLELNELKTQNAQLALENRELHIKTEAVNRILNEPSNDHNSTLNDLSIEVALLQTKVESVNKELEESKKKADESESQLLQSATREEELQAELRALQKAVDSEKQAREEAVSKVRQLENEVDRLATIEVERDSLRTCNDRLQESLEMHTAQLAEIQTKADTWPKEKCSLEASLESMMQERENVQRKWNAALVEKKILEEAIAKINANSDSSNAVNMGEFTRQLAETMHQNESLKRNLDELRNAKEGIAKELSLIMQENTALQKKLESISEENARQLAKLQEDLKQAEFERKRRDEQLSALINEDSERKRVDATSDKHPEELRGLKRQVAQLTQQIVEKEINCQRCRENLEQAQIAQDKLRSLSTLNADLRKQLEDKKEILTTYVKRVNDHRDEMRQRDELQGQMREQFEEKLQHKEKEISRLRKQLEAGESRMKEKMASATKIADEMKLLQGKYNMLKDQWDEIWVRQKTAEDKLQKSNEERQQLDEELESTKTMVEELRLQLEKTDKAKQNAIDAEGEDREAQLQEALKRAEQLDQTVHKLNLQIDELQSEVAARKKDIETLLVQKKNGVTLFNKLKKEKDELAEQLERIRQERGELKEKYEGLKQELRLLNEQLASSKNSTTNEPNRSDRTDKQTIIASPRKPLSASTHENVPRDSA